MTSRRKLVVRIKGGLGNQLFCYAAARRLALVNEAELVVDDVSGFTVDRQYNRRYSLGHFSIRARSATPNERFYPFERARRTAARVLARTQPFEARSYLEQQGMDFDPRLLSVRVFRPVYLDGYWQSEGYFADIKKTIREDLRMQPPQDERNLGTADAIRALKSAAIHVRWFERPDREAKAGGYNLSQEYYLKAVRELEERVGKVHYFLFSDTPDAAIEKLKLPADRVTVVTHNSGDTAAIYDLWLMAQCQHFIIANSTFSWWGAWLGTSDSKTVIAPLQILHGTTSWGFKGLLPNNWITVKAGAL